VSMENEDVLFPIRRTELPEIVGMTGLANPGQYSCYGSDLLRYSWFVRC